MPPVAPRVTLYAVPTVPPARAFVETVGDWTAVATVKVRAFTAVALAASFACTVNDAVPEVVGVPLITPDEESVRPKAIVPEVIVHV